MFNLTIAASERATENESDYIVYQDVELSGLYKSHLSKCKQGQKLGKGLVRGALVDVPRNNENLEYSKLLIVDADGGLNGKATPSVESCHEALKALGYSHVIYTTHSHKAEFHKYRALVELNDQIQEHELAANMHRLIDELRAQGCPLKYAHEMSTWSQIWFLPRSENPDSFVSYGWFEGETFEAIHLTPEEAGFEEGEKADKPLLSSRSETLDELFTNIRNGKEFHESTRNLSYQLAKDNVSPALNEWFIRSIYQSCPESVKASERWNGRWKEIERVVKGAYDRISGEKKEFDITAVPQTCEYTPPPMPPARLGRFIQQIMDGMYNPRIEFAFPMALASLAAICGAKFNAKCKILSGLNLYMTVVADTGTGKGQISKFYNSLFMGGLDGRIINVAGGNGSASFVGSNNYTAPKALHAELLKARSFVSCMQEAGIMLGAKSGNADELSAYVMEIYPNSTREAFTATRSYSSADNNLTPVRSPALTMVLESTEDSLADSLRNMNAVRSGYIPRQTMFKAMGRPTEDLDEAETPVKRKYQYEFDADIIEQLRALMLECAKIQALPDFENNIVHWSKEQRRHAMELKNHYAHDYTAIKLEDDIATRMLHKIIKFAALCAVFNGWKEGDIQLDQESWEWGVAMGKWEMDNLQYNLSYMNDDSTGEEVYRIIKERLAACLKHKDLSEKQKAAKVLKIELLMRLATSPLKNVYAKGNNGGRISFVNYLLMRLGEMQKLGYVKVHNEGHALFRRNAEGKGTVVIEVLEEINNL